MLVCIRPIGCTGEPLARDPDMARPEREEMGVVAPYPGDLVRGEP